MDNGGMSEQDWLEADKQRAKFNELLVNGEYICTDKIISKLNKTVNKFLKLKYFKNWKKTADDIKDKGYTQVETKIQFIDKYIKIDFKLVIDKLSFKTYVYDIKVYKGSELLYADWYHTDIDEFKSLLQEYKVTRSEVDYELKRIKAILDKFPNWNFFIVIDGGKDGKGSIRKQPK